MEKLKIILTTHGIIFKTPDRRSQEAALSFCKSNLIQWEWKKSPPTWKAVKVMKRVFAGATKTRSEFRFHRHQYDELFFHLIACGYARSAIETIDKSADHGVKVKFIYKTPIEPRDYQIPIVAHLTQTVPTVKVTNLQTGKGKLQGLNSKVKIPGGWKRMGDIHVGDIVTAHDGSPTRVMGVFPQGRKWLYRVTFADGRSTLAGAEHLWKIYYVNTSKDKRWRVVDTKEMIRLINMPNPRVYVPLCESEVIDDVKLDIPPYTLGVILGDGNLTNTGLRITKGDEQVFDHICQELPENLEIRKLDRLTRSITSKVVNTGNVYIHSLKAFGLMGKSSYEKFIPEIYLNASTDQRLSLLQGLMDTDGTTNKVSCGGSTSYSTTSYQLATDVQYLVRSLGGIAKISIRSPKYTYKGEKKKGRKAYNISIRFKRPSDLFKLDRKKDRTNDEGQYASKLKLKVSSITPETIEETQCISIEHEDSLYVTDDFIVTHNTACALMSMVQVGKRTMIQLRGGYVTRWIDDLEELFDFKKGEIVVIRGRDALLSMINQGKSNDVEAKVIIITAKTVYKLLEEFEKDGEDNYYGIRPEELYELLGIGLRIVDEVHEDYHLSFRSDIYCHVESSIHLSATLITEDPFRRKMYDIALPQSHWIATEYDAYCGVKAIFYQTDCIDKLKLKERGQDMYSHGAYEKSILKDDKMTISYLEIIRDPIQVEFIESYEPGQKCLAFCRLVEMCELVSDYLKQFYPELNIGVFVAESDDSALKENDIIVSTVQSCGTAQDIPNLKVSVLTQALNKLETNEQVKGRLRKLKRWPDITPVMCYLNNAQVPKHVEYHDNKVQQYQGKVAWHKRVDSPYVLSDK